MASNSLTSLNPTFWVAEGLRIFREKLVLIPSFTIDYNPAVARAGKIVSVSKRGELYARRKLAGTDVVASALTADETLIRLNQQPYVHYAVEDIEEATSLGDVVNEFIEPGFFGIVRYMDQAGAMQCYDFFRNQAGGDLVNSASYADLIALRRELNRLKIPLEERSLFVNNEAEAALLLESKLTEAAMVGDGNVLRNGLIATGGGFQILSTLNLPVAGDNVNKAVQHGLINNTGGYPKGATVLTCDGFTGGTTDVVTVGSFCTISQTDTAGSAISVHQITAKTDSGAPATTAITVIPALPRAVADNAIITVYHPGTADASYAAQYAGLVRVDMTSTEGTTIPDEFGGISFAADGPVYGIMSVTAVSGQANHFDLELNRPLDEAITSGDAACLFPPVPISWSFTRDAVALVERPLRLPKGATAAAIGNENGISIRTVIGYDQKAQEELVTVDTLFGLRTLDMDKGALLIG